MSCLMFCDNKTGKSPSRLGPDLMKPLPPKPLSVNKVTFHKTTEARTIQILPRSPERDCEMSMCSVHLVMLTKPDGKMEEAFLFQPDVRINDPWTTTLAYRIEFCGTMSEEGNFF